MPAPPVLARSEPVRLGRMDLNPLFAGPGPSSRGRVERCPVCCADLKVSPR